MGLDKDIRFTEKKVDEAWKSQIDRDKEKAAPRPAPASDEKKSTPSKDITSSPVFLNLVTSLAYQAMMHLGEIPDPATQVAEANLDAAKETIDLLMALKEKTEGNLSEEENTALTSILGELQMKFSNQ